MTASPELPDPASLSVVVPTFNDLARIGDALDSIVGQSARPAEIVVSDDASEQDVEGFVREFAAHRAHGVAVRYVRLASNSGDAAARNAGIAAASGAWIAICDSDDVWSPVKLERQIGFIRGWTGTRRIALLGTHGYNVNDQKRIISRAIMGATSEQQYESIRRRGGLFFAIHSSIMYSRADYDALGGYSTDEYGAANEFDLFCRMAERGVVMNLAEPLVYYRKRAGSMQLDLFWDRHRNVTRLAENQRRRARGQPPIGKQEFAVQLAAEPVWRRLMRRKRVWGMYYYRAGATDMVNGRRLRGGAELALASTLDSARLRHGLRRALSGRLPRRGPRERQASGEPTPSAWPPA
jgi:glycosyltransferase involved in cell wall biosynthesis